MAHHRRVKVACYRGRYHRTIGWYINSKGERARRKFHLGTDRRTATIAAGLLEELWSEVVAEHEHVVAWMERMGGRLTDTNLITYEADGWRREKLADGPIWRAESLMIADAIRRGERQVAVHPSGEETPEEYLRRVDLLRGQYSVVAFVPAAPDVFELGRQHLTEEARDHVEEAETLSRLAEAPVPAAADAPSLYEALDAFSEYVRRDRDAEHNRIEAAAAQRLKASIDDLPLHQFNRAALEQIARYWKGRPEAKLRGGKSSGRRISLDTVARQLRVARRFVKWLDLSEEFAWQAPRYYEDALKADLRRLRTDDEIAALKDGVQLFSIDELTTLYRLATDQERLFIVLALNIGGSHAELCTLRCDELNQDGKPPTIKRIRRKTGVYGAFTVWAETLRAINWHVDQQSARERRRPELLLTGNGQPFDRQRLAGAWDSLLKRVGKQDPTFRRLPFKSLRKTAGNLVRERSNGEIAGVFLCHGQPVRSDDLSDVYTRRPFHKVAEALDAVHKDLRPMFEAAPQAFTRSQTKRRRSSVLGHARG